MICSIYCKGDFACGNLSTAIYIRDIIQKVIPNSKVVLNAIRAGNNKLNEELVKEATKNVDLVIIIHLKRCFEAIVGLESHIPVIAVCGGTDLNEDPKNADYMQQMTQSVERSRAVVLFSPSMLDQFVSLWPNYRGYIEVISQSVTVDVDKAISRRDECLSWLGSELKCKTVNRFFLVVGRLRPVKDPGYALQPFLEWNSFPLPNSNKQENTPFHHHLIYIGSVEDNAPSIQSFLLSLTDPENKCVHHLESIEPDLLHAIMLASDGLINCSLSEGQSVTIMEALSLGTPVIARDNAGNRDLIQHNVNGLLFASPDELKVCLTRLCCEPDLRSTLVRGGHSTMQESRFQRSNQVDSYAKLLAQINLNTKHSGSNIL